MLLRNVFTKTIRDLRWPTFWVSLGMGGMTGYFALLFPTYSKIFDLNAMLEKMGPAAKILGASVGGGVIAGITGRHLHPGRGDGRDQAACRCPVDDHVEGMFLGLDRTRANRRQHQADTNRCRSHGLIS